MKYVISDVESNSLIIAPIPCINKRPDHSPHMYNSLFIPLISNAIITQKEHNELMLEPIVQSVVQRTLKLQDLGYTTHVRKGPCA